MVTILVMNTGVCICLLSIYLFVNLFIYLSDYLSILSIICLFMYVINQLSYYLFVISFNLFIYMIYIMLENKIRLN